jgi:hypothetical protein
LITVHISGPAGSGKSGLAHLIGYTLGLHGIQVSYIDTVDANTGLHKNFKDVVSIIDSLRNSGTEVEITEFAQRVVKHRKPKKTLENIRFEKSWAREFPDDPEAGTRFLRDDSNLYIDMSVRAAFVLWLAAKKEDSGEPDAFCVTAENGDCVSNDPRCMHRKP